MKVSYPIEIEEDSLQIDTYVADFPCELISSMEAPTYDLTHPRNFQRILHILVPDCLPGDKITGKAAFGVTSEHSLTEVSSGMILTPNSTGTSGIVDVSGNQFAISLGENPNPGVWMTKFPGRNVTDEIHHDFHTHTADVIVPEGMSGDLYVAVIAYADAGTYFSPSPRYVSIEPHSSHISAIRVRTNN